MLSERKSASLEMGKLIEFELSHSKMQSARFNVDFQTKPDLNGIPMQDGKRIAFDQNGFDRVEFLIAPNPGEVLKPLAKIASCGETSRLMLGLRIYWQRLMKLRPRSSMNRSGHWWTRLAWWWVTNFGISPRTHQVFCATHLPQLAVFGDQHYQVQTLAHWPHAYKG